MKYSNKVTDLGSNPRKSTNVEDRRDMPKGAILDKKTLAKKRSAAKKTLKPKLGKQKMAIKVGAHSMDDATKRDKAKDEKKVKHLLNGMKHTSRNAIPKKRPKK